MSEHIFINSPNNTDEHVSIASLRIPLHTFRFHVLSIGSMRPLCCTLHRNIYEVNRKSFRICIPNGFLFLINLSVYHRKEADSFYTNTGVVSNMHIHKTWTFCNSSCSRFSVLYFCLFVCKPHCIRHC